MMKIFLSIIIVILSLGSLSAQTFKVNLKGQPSANVNADDIDTLKILVIMVNFQEDRDGTTFGNGKFGSIYSVDYGTTILDPLPHDADYFSNHLQFVRNYYKKVSNNKLYIDFTILPDTFSVSQTMRNYSPPPGIDDFKPVGDFAVEAWTLADQLYPGFDFSTYDLFTIFHAGVGRDISLPGSIGNERDLPSLYLSDLSFKEIYGDEFEGIPVSGGSFNITNSMIMPETESRELSTFTGIFLFQITINGLLAASIGSHLGLPDLFDTETGLSAIGRFGLMDGQGIFAYSGTYPPEPTPWSKIFMGWAEPVTVELGNADISIVTKLAAEIGDTVILKVPLNSSEYYLIENRNRDANNDGSTVTYVVNGNTMTKTFTKDTTGYLSFDVDSLEGVIIDVDEFDWAVPGNGILIWHIDENVINEKIVANKINTDKKRRGVDVEEADGIQDIGEEFQTIFGDIVIGEGTDRDFWYSSNPSELFTTRFAKDTRPNTKTNSGANSLITLTDFSEISNRMNFKVVYGDSIVKPLFVSMLPLQTPFQGFSYAASLNESNFNILADSNLHIVYEGNIILTLSNFSKYKTPSIKFENLFFTYGTIGTMLNVRISDGSVSYVGAKDVGSEITAQPVIRINSLGELEVLVGTDNGEILIFDPGSLPSNDPVLKSSLEIDTLFIIKQITSREDYFAFITESKFGIVPPSPIMLFYDSEGNSFPFTAEFPVDLAVTKNKNGKNVSIVLTSNNKFYIIELGLSISEFTVQSSDSILTFALADLKQDGTNYIVLNNGTNIEAYNLTGAVADNFPFADPQGIGFIGTPLTADFEGDNKSEIISITKDGRIFAIDGGTGKVVSGFPISTGTSVSTTPVLYNANGKTNLAVLNDQSILSAWSISSIEGKLFWVEENGNPQNTSFVPAADNNNAVNEFFPTNRAYNYPNPVYEGETKIRYYVSEDSKINIKIFDLAGDFVAELSDDAQGGMDNETVWNVSNIQSGIYLTRIEAVSISGKSEFAIIKIAVVK
jgi:Secretion system C-terminal sorting domain